MTYIHKAFLLFLITINFGISAHASPAFQNQAKCLEKSAFLQDSFKKNNIFRDINSTETDKIVQTIREQSSSIKKLIADAIIKDCPVEIGRIIKYEELKIRLPITFADERTIYVTLPPVKSSDLESLLNDVLAAIWISYSPKYYIGEKISRSEATDSPLLSSLPTPTHGCLQDILKGDYAKHTRVGKNAVNMSDNNGWWSFELKDKYKKFKHFKGKFNYPKSTSTGGSKIYDIINKYQVLPADDNTSYFPYLLGAKHIRGSGKPTFGDRHFYGDPPSTFYYPIFFNRGFRPILDFIKELKKDINSKCQSERDAWNNVYFYIVGISNDSGKGIKKEVLTENTKKYDRKAKDSIRILYGPIPFQDD